MKLNICDKRQSVLDAEGHCLVVGGPGSGKTTLALLKGIKEIEDGLAAGQKILFLSFPRAAVARIVNAAKMEVPADNQSLISVQTFHSFFWQILKAHGYLLGAPRHLSILLAHDEKAMCKGIRREDAEWCDWEAKRRDMFHDKGRVCFDLFAPLAAELLRRANRIRDRVASRYPLILVDEAPDTNNEQWDCVSLLAEKSQIICLADPNQMIYDFLPGIGSNRIDDIQQTLDPHKIDLEEENNRSPKTEIVAFGRDILSGQVRGSPYKGVSRFKFNPKTESRDRFIRQSIGILCKRIMDATNQSPESIAFMASYGKGVAVISSALQLDRPIRHQVLFDEAFGLLSSRAVAFLLEPKDSSSHLEDVAMLLDIAGAAFRAKGKKSALLQSEKCIRYADSIRISKLPKVNIVRAASNLVASARNRIFTGDPRKDWSSVKQDLRQLGDRVFREMVSSLDYLVALGRGQQISKNLSSIWMKHGNYLGARVAFHAALARNQLLSAEEQVNGIYVMNMHKCKGKEFDGVILYRQQYHSPFVWRGEATPYTRSRRLLHTAITRAKWHVLILDEAYPDCPIIGPHDL